MNWERDVPSFDFSAHRYIPGMTLDEAASFNYIWDEEIGFQADPFDDGISDQCLAEVTYDFDENDISSTQPYTDDTGTSSDTCDTFESLI